VIIICSWKKYKRYTEYEKNIFEQQLKQAEHKNKNLKENIKQIEQEKQNIEQDLKDTKEHALILNCYRKQ
jgi:septal ring factor EnvC (AmiA/AmiB activator)